MIKVNLVYGFFIKVQTIKSDLFNKLVLELFKVYIYITYKYNR